MNKIPQVVLIGRMNVGKSSLFNRIAKRTSPLMLDYEGVTRDFITENITWQETLFTLVDTGGVSLKKFEDPIIEKVRQQALALAEQADVVLFMVDASVGVLPEELELAKRLHKTGRTVIIVANKFDKKVAQEHLEECKRLGFDVVVPISAAHNQGVSELMDELIKLLPRKKIQKETTKERICRVTLLGKPNVGKSSLMNLLLNRERSIVTEIAGTTREAVSETLQYYSQTIQLTDTAGIRRKKKVEGELEELMVKSSMQAVRTSDIVLLLVDAQDGRLTDQELKLAFYAFEQGKAVIILINKSDLLSDAYTKEQWKYHREEYEFFYKKIETMNISCENGDNVGKILPLIATVWERYLHEFSSDELTSILKQALIRRPLYKQEHQLKIYDAQQVKSGPPTIKLRVSLPQFFGERELAYFEGVLRKNYELKSIPIEFISVKKKGSV
ncbi:TPA: ribosome biogenesis GTPase Der [Candidatus Dependentiae bacterium]|nr:MAG: GTP-binding protein EngA [candidate division TM6 bacterium GW2011_GWF2_36_131]KKQ03007.1 MAG: GTP-binding protein EngA [candidate division TM6 bacterium GW2011_GWE2_36_25]KKQ19564.1 MAG: GTP-binding protein EngA [candidate division TM6 bacterium GW2011_GWA2_36_9]HBR71078.1 ribosome biogenesis GTPase Der [Candidatus Dependentiae bacterium]HCU01026.1 ribosome biogenesis GTPase Der [Candidatus Dependentiae bacterium]